MSEAKSYALRNRQGSDWFTHEEGSKTSDPSPQHELECQQDVEEQNGEESGNTPRTQMIKPVCNSNEWYKHDKVENDGEENMVSSVAKEKPLPDRQSGGDWYSHEAKNDDKPADVKVRVGSSEGQAYCTRDKTGSSSIWFAHEHDIGSTQTVDSGPRVNTAEGSSNATRMRSQSENWFSHDGKADLNGPHHTSKGRGNRPQSSEMHQIFHMGAE